MNPGNTHVRAITPSRIARIAVAILAALAIVLATSPRVGAATAMLVKDVSPGAAHGFDTTPDLVAFNGALWFWAPGGLWRSDGTESGTELAVTTPLAGQ
ncbi:MAG TPA: hypothetical protein VF071_05930, partial [Candidatus Limnocylindria bacterium]